MVEDVVLNWDRIVHKNVRSSDGQDAGNIVHIAGDNLRIMRGTSRQYDIPKHLVDGFDGSEVHLSIPLSEMGNYEAK